MERVAVVERDERVAEATGSQGAGSEAPSGALRVGAISTSPCPYRPSIIASRGSRLSRTVLPICSPLRNVTMRSAAQLSSKLPSATASQMSQTHIGPWIPVRRLVRLEAFTQPSSASHPMSPASQPPCLLDSVGKVEAHASSAADSIPRQLDSPPGQPASSLALSPSRASSVWCCCHVTMPPLPAKKRRELYSVFLLVHLFCPSILILYTVPSAADTWDTRGHDRSSPQQSPSTAPINPHPLSLNPHSRRVAAVYPYIVYPYIVSVHAFTVYALQPLSLTLPCRICAPHR